MEAGVVWFSRSVSVQKLKNNYTSKNCTAKLWASIFLLSVIFLCVGCYGSAAATFEWGNGNRQMIQVASVHILRSFSARILPANAIALRHKHKYCIESLPLLSQSTNSILKASNQHDRSVDKIKCSPCQQTFKTGIWFLSWGLGCDESPLGWAAWHRSRRATMPLVLQRAAEKLDGFEEEMLIVASGRWQ